MKSRQLLGMKPKGPCPTIGLQPPTTTSPQMPTVASISNLLAVYLLMRISSKSHIPYSLDIMPPSFISPPYYLHKFAVEAYLSPIYASHGKVVVQRLHHVF